MKLCITAPSNPVRKEADSMRPGALAAKPAQRSQRGRVADPAAACGLDDVELVVMGSLMAPMSFYRAQGVSFEYEPPRPHGQVLELMQTCDALVLPSIVEGRALVQQEAMANGMPLIITKNTGGEDLIVPGETGFLVPIRSPEMIAEKVAWLADHREALPAMRVAAVKKAEEYPWLRYRQRVVSALTATLDESRKPEVARA